ncbi:hypothetical protein H340_29149 [Streptomyces mobaraensis NBRC 13819 = DSM 40847]|uniref:Uncharacterized protein n=1 Tax=Streptomyces mobaraensis (strain ATCC 29032 / DSM 40847 / JCM 4168 / NBRC 13819 / NCIMB 11159 / IPCR 16-22) TaxID=1223523 RepID=M3BYT0_STRM1|nr:hypothetical protein H340_29149 [Streptomyces mobaraensis NBRC 13819 = DSM 40847]
MVAEVDDDVEPLAGRDVERVVALGCGKQPAVAADLYEPSVPTAFDVEPEPVAAGVGAVEQAEAVAAAGDLELRCASRAAC